MTLVSPELLVTPKLFEEVLSSRKNLVALETSNAPVAIAQLRPLAMRSGQSVYLWQPDVGIVSLRESEVRVPGTHRLGDAFRYVLRSIHFGVYVFAGFDTPMKAQDTLLLRSISRISGGNERKIVLVGGKLVLPDDLDGLFEHLYCGLGRQRQLRLRDGKWVN